MKKHFYVTTPIYYPNAKPHIGSLYTTILADIIARFYCGMGYDVCFLTGTDEHGQKVFDAAQAKGMDTQKFVDDIAHNFELEWKKYNIDYTIFMRTTNEYHKKAVQQWIVSLQEKGFIYKSSYAGWYSVSAEAFLTEKDCEVKNEQGTPICSLSGKEAVWITQEAYFFKLSAFQDQLLTFLKENPHWITPHEKAQEVINFIESGLKDLCISRLKSSLQWGIPFPNDDNHVIYVWADALNNYLTGIGYLQPSRTEEFNKFWPCDLHILGKDILRFHVAYWLAFLMAGDLPLPKRELVHGWILFNNQKMSKSLGNTISPDDLCARYNNIDKIRYFFARYLPITQDSSFSYEEFDERTNADLADSLGNLLQRVIVLGKKTLGNIIQKPHQWSAASQQLHTDGITLYADIQKDLDDYMLHRVSANIWKYIRKINEYFHTQEPWKHAKNNKDVCGEIISAALHALRSVASAIWPFMPESAYKINYALGISDNKNDYNKPLMLDVLNAQWNHTFELRDITEILFTKIETVPREEINNNKAISEEVIIASSSPEITIDDFKKIELRVGFIEHVEEIPKSSRLFKLTVNFGDYGTRTICSGIKEYYKADELMHKNAVFIFNLKPRPLCGVNSHGMILTTHNDQGKPCVVFIDSAIKPGIILG